MIRRLNPLAGLAMAAALSGGLLPSAYDVGIASGRAPKRRKPAPGAPNARRAKVKAARKANSARKR